MAAGALLRDIDMGRVDAAALQLQTTTERNIEPPVSQAGFRGDLVPEAGSLAEGIADRAVDFVFVGADSRTDGDLKLSRGDVELTGDGFNHFGQQAVGGTTPADMRSGDDVACGMPEQDGKTVGGQYPDHDVPLVGDDGIHFDRKKVAQVRIGFVHQQDIVAMHLLDRQQLVRRHVEAAGERRAVPLDIR